MSVVLVEREPPIAVVLDRPEALNALNDEVMAELVDALEALDEDEGIRCIVLGGSGAPSPPARTSARWPRRARWTCTRRGASTAGTPSAASALRSLRPSPASASAAATSWHGL